MSFNRPPSTIRALLEQHLGQWILFGSSEVDSLAELENRLLTIYNLLQELPRDEYYHSLSHYVIPRAVFFSMVFSAHQRQQFVAARPERESTPVRDRVRPCPIFNVDGETGSSAVPDPE